MQNRNRTITLVVVAIIAVIALSAKVRTSYNPATTTGDDAKTGDTVNKSEQTGTINTEDMNAPEIIIDEEKLDDLPQQDAEPQKMEEIKDEQPTAPAPSDLPESISLDIPFYAQAPDGDRELPRKEACEEASLVLAAHYIKDKKLTKSEFKADVIALTKVEEELFGTYIDTTVEQTAQLYDKYYGIGKTKIIDNPTIDQIKSELAQGHPIVAPFAGRKLGNSNFTAWGPRYHMLVIRGYDEKYFYTNDVGTKHGENFPYTYAVIMDALHDLVREGEWDIATGKKRILVLLQ